jgi:calcineurin-like phosphoesterase family protein
VIYFTADTHFGHENILTYCDRPFATVDEMDNALIENWNAVIGPADTVYHLGDFTLGGICAAHDYFAKLNGVIRVLRYPWHHDGCWVPKIADMDRQFRSAQGTVVRIDPPVTVLGLPAYGDDRYSQTLVLCHYPFAVWDRKHYGAWHLFGHSHGQHQNGGFSFDVGVDCNQFRPVSLDGVVRQMRAYGWTGPAHFGQLK